MRHLSILGFLALLAITAGGCLGDANAPVAGRDEGRDEDESDHDHDRDDFDGDRNVDRNEGRDDSDRNDDRGPHRDGSDEELSDRDGDGRVGNADCNDRDEDVHDGAPEVCDGKDNDCDGITDEGCDRQPPPPPPPPPEPENDDNAQDSDGVPPREHLLTIEVGRNNEQSAITFSWGYCSDVTDGRQCHDWHENAWRVLWDTAVRSQSLVVEETGVVRFNAEFYTDGDSDVRGDDIVGEPNGWLAERQTGGGCALTATVLVWLDGEQIRPRINAIPFQDGCSTSVDIAELVRLAN